MTEKRFNANHRVYGEFKVGMKLGKKWRMQHSMALEHSFRAGSKFKDRIFYTNKLYYRNKKLPLGLKPYFTQKLYWYQGGRPLQYYDAEGDRAEKVSPDGLHAYRAILGISMKLSRNISFSIYFMNQQEFNTSLFGSKNINVLNPNKNTINRKFNNYSVLGFSTSFTI